MPTQEAMELSQRKPIEPPPRRPVIGRVNAAFFGFMDWYMHWKYRDLKADLLGGLPPVVVELGAGTGANFRYLSPGTRVIAVEPNRYMHGRLKRSARRWKVDLELRDIGAEGLDLPDSSADAVVCSLVLCTVEDPSRALAEVRRVLRPGGRFICIEHVGASPSTFIGRVQRWVFRPWKWFFEGCHTHRDTERVLNEAGFSSVDIRRFTFRSAFLPVRPQIAAVCLR